MFDDQQNGNPITEALAEETQQIEQAQQEPQVAQQPVEEQRPQRNADKEYNFRLMRERAEAAERRAAELERMHAPKQEQDRFEIEDDGLVEGKHLRKYDTRTKRIEEELAETKRQLANFTTVSAEMQLRAKYNDFDSIVTDENVERLSREKPALYRSILSNPDLKDKGETAYEAIRAFLQPRKYEEVDKKIAENKSKPRSSATVNPQSSDSPLARAGDYDRRSLSEARKAELYAEMMEAKKRY